MEIMTTMVERQEPRNSRIIKAVSAAAITPSRTTLATADLTNTDWSNSSLILRPGGAAARATCSTERTPLTTSRVEALPFLMTLSRTARSPFSRTMFCCTAEPSRTWPMSLMKTVAPLVNLTGILLSSSIEPGVALVRTVYCVLAIFTWPDGRVRFCALTAFTTSSGVSPRASNLFGSISTMIWRYLPPAGVGKVTPGTGANCWRRR